MTREEAFPGLEARFSIEAVVGAGSMGTVYRARDESSGKTVAIKRLKSLDPADMRRFEREFAITSKLSHPAIVASSELGKTADGSRYIVMEWLEGESLRERFRRSELTLEETLAMALRLSAALASAHERGIVHRDVKPANVLLEGTRAEAAKLVDFGIARLVASGETVTRSGELVGTPGYVSPEQIRGGRVDQRSDVYALGCLLFRCLAGRAVFEDDNVVTLLVRVSSDRAPALASLRPDLPAGLSHLVDRMLAREPIDRPADAGEVLHELESLARTMSSTDESELSARPRPRQRIPVAPVGEETGDSSGASPPTAVASEKAVLPTARVSRIVVVLAAASALLMVVLRVSRDRDGATSGASPSAVSSAQDRIGAGAQSAWGSIRLGARSAALRGMTERVRRGSASASEHLWLALLSSPGDDAKRRQREAAVRAPELTPFERAVLDAAEPLLATPAEFAKANRALSELAETWRSPELWLVLGRLRTQMNDRASANAAIDRAAGDPWAVAALVERTWVEREFFDVGAARTHAKVCLEKRADAPECIAFLGRRAALEGDCSGMEAHARRWIDADPDDPRAHETLAFALAARGEKDEAVREALEQKWARLGEPERTSARARDSVNLASLNGRFDEAKALARAELDRLGADAPLLERLTASFTLLTIAAETEDRRLVRELSSRILERAAAATPPTPYEAAYFLLFVGANEYPEENARWEQVRARAFARYTEYSNAQGANVRPFQRVLPWIVGHAAGASTEERLKRAYEALPSYEPLPPPGMSNEDDLVMGRVLAANGERERGLGHLESVTRSCLVLENPFALARALRVTGEVREAANENEAAGKAYRQLIDRWGRASPRSRSAEAARAALKRMKR